LTLPLIIISGPTCSGKSSIAIEIAKMTKGEIINADSMQVYSELKILTDRPLINNQKKIKHHLYGHISAKKRYNVAQWCQEAKNIISENNKKKKQSILVGGTGMYIESLIKGISNIPSIDEIYKKESENILNKIGFKKFYYNVLKIDKKSCLKINTNDVQRLKRIWEVYKATGRTLSEWQNESHKLFLKNISYQIFLFLPDRKKIYEKINNRFSTMIKSGGLNEVKKLLDLNLDKSLPAMKAHGVKEIGKFLNNEITLDECIKKSQQITRNYAKRQISWWNSSKLENISIFSDFPKNIDLKALKLA
tara:strand:+ start:6330 stop:7247 length:918 start_codon:yes stop_codon:yes gene_type:complete